MQLYALVDWDDNSTTVIKLEHIEEPRKPFMEYCAGDRIFSRCPPFPGKHWGEIAEINADRSILSTKLSKKSTDRRSQENKENRAAQSKTTKRKPAMAPSAVNAGNAKRRNQTVEAISKRTGQNKAPSPVAALDSTKLTVSSILALRRSTKENGNGNNTALLVTDKNKLAIYSRELMETPSTVPLLQIPSSNDCNIPNPCSDPCSDPGSDHVLSFDSHPENSWPHHDFNDSNTNSQHGPLNFSKMAANPKPLNPENIYSQNYNVTQSSPVYQNRSNYNYSYSSSPLNNPQSETSRIHFDARVSEAHRSIQSTTNFQTLSNGHEHQTQEQGYASFHSLLDLNARQSPLQNSNTANAYDSRSPSCLSSVAGQMQSAYDSLYNSSHTDLSTPAYLPTNSCHSCCILITELKEEVEKLKRKMSNRSRPEQQATEEERYKGKTKDELMRLAASKSSLTEAVKILLLALFTEEELSTCSLKGKHTNKSYEQKSGLDETRRNIAEAVLGETFKVNVNIVRNKIRDRLKMIRKSHAHPAAI